MIFRNSEAKRYNIIRNKINNNIINIIIFNKKEGL